MEGDAIRGKHPEIFEERSQIMRRFNRFMALRAFTVLLVYAQDVSGDWQGTLKASTCLSVTPFRSVE
jgi:hypothetical protein